MLFPELCDNSSLHWGPLHNAFIFGTSLHIKQIKSKGNQLLIENLH